jgi:hypothetical protein
MADGGHRALIPLILAIGYYTVLMTAGGGLFDPVPHGLVFNDMLLHLLRGRFDVDPASIGDEGYIRDGATYAYFGIAPALYRLVFLPFPGFQTTDFTRVACLTAVATMAIFKTLTALAVAGRFPERRTRLLLPFVLAVILLGGSQIEFLRPSIFQETALWAAACSAGFIYLFVVGWLGDDGFTPRLMAKLALVAGLCLLTRVSTALGLYIAFGGLWLISVWRDRRLARTYAPAAAIAAVFAVLAAGINLARWGNPLVFVDLNRALILARFPDRLARLHAYGEFNPIRLLYGLGYYFAPLWAMGDGGKLWWQAFQERTIDGAELPPASFFVSDTLWVGLAIYGLIALLSRGRLPRRELVLSALPGLLGPIALMLIAIAMTFRYRLEFYPFFDLCAFAGFARLLASPPSRPANFVIGTGAIAGVVTAHATWLLYMLSPFGPAQTVTNGLPVATFYRSLLP